MKNKRIKGFTLVEMMITVAIVGIVAMIMPSIMMNITRFFRLNTARIETQRQRDPKQPQVCPENDHRRD